mmetsp:Transcript_11080/g.28018  ORF Transcript_11080/g.28018 Transcript_11080/m.28018 type:complete len:241 (-) Transcript_11080:33-755(-)
MRCCTAKKIDAAYRAPSPRDSRSPKRDRDGYAQRCRQAAEAGKPRHEVLHQEQRKLPSAHVAHGEGVRQRDLAGPRVTADDDTDLRSLPYCGRQYIEEKQQADHLMRLFEEFLETEDGQLYTQAREAKLHQRRQSQEHSLERPGQRLRCGFGASKSNRSGAVVISDSAANSPVLAMRKAEAARYRKYVEERKQALFRQIAQETLPVTRVRDTKIEKFPLWRVQDRIACDQVVMHRRQPKM